MREDIQVALNRDEAKEIGPNIQGMLSRLIRAQRHPELFIGLSQDLIDLFKREVPSEDRHRFENVFSQEQRENLELVLHPFFKRLTLFERTWHKGQPLWHPVCMFHTDPEEDRVPTDLYNRWGEMIKHMQGRIGEFRHATYQDFEFVEKCDFRKYGWEQVDEFLQQFIENEEREKEARFTDQLDDFLDHAWWSAMQDCQEHYSKPWSVRDVELKSDPGRWKIEQKNGYTVRTRIWGEEGDINEMQEVAKGNYEPLSASGKAAQRILEIKNENYRKRHGISLWEAATGERFEWEPISQDDVAQQTENRRQARELLEMAQDAPIPEHLDVTVEEWLKELKEAQKVAV